MQIFTKLRFECSEFGSGNQSCQEVLKIGFANLTISDLAWKYTMEDIFLSKDFINYNGNQPL